MKLIKIISLVMAILMLFVFVGCNGKDTDNGPGATPDTTPDTTPGDDKTDPDDENPGTGTGDPVEYVPVADFLKNMASSQYRNNDLVDANIGLTDHTVVGVDEDKYRNEELYGVPADGEFAHIYNVADYGITPEATDNASKINTLLNDIKKVEGLKKVEFPAGVYLIEKTISLVDQSDLYFCCADEGQHFELRMSAWFQGFVISGCKNVHLNSFDFDFVDSPTVAGEIIEVKPSAKTVTVRIFDEFDLSRPVYTSRGIRTYLEFKINERGEWAPYNNVEGGSLKSYDHETRTMTLNVNSMTLDATEVGTRVSLSYTVYDYFGFNGGSNDGLYFEDVNVYAAAGMAFAFGESSVYMNRVDIDLREGSTRLMTATADGLHCSNCPIVKVTNSTSQYTHDDSFNIKGTYYTVLSSAAKVLTFRTSSPSVDVGNQIEIFEPTRFGHMGTYTVVSIDPQNPGKITLDKRIDEDLTGCVFMNVSKAPTFHLENSVLGNKRNRAMLIQCHNTVIKGNTLKDYYHGSVCIHTVMDQFKEGICPRSVEVTNNKFLSTAGGVSAGSFGTSGTAVSGLFKYMTVKNNFFYKSGVYMGFLADSEVSNNLFYRTGEGATSADSCCAINISLSERVTVKDNYSYHEVTTKKYKVLYDSGVEDLEKSKNVYVVLNK